MSITVHIDELALYGFELTSAQGRTLQTSFERELSKLITRSHLLPALSPATYGSSVCPATIELAGGAHPQRIGLQLAEAVFGQISQPGRSLR